MHIVAQSCEESTERHGREVASQEPRYDEHRMAVAPRRSEQSRHGCEHCGELGDRSNFRDKEEEWRSVVLEGNSAVVAGRAAIHIPSLT
jgi:hypothetical protein